MAVSARIVATAACLLAALAGAQEPPKRYTLTDKVIDIEPGTTMFALVFEFYPERKNGWLHVAGDLAEANPDAFRNGDPGDVIVGRSLRLIDYGDGTLVLPDGEVPVRSAAQADAERRAPPPRAREPVTPAPVNSTDGGSADVGVETASATAAAPVARRIGRVSDLDGNLRALGRDQRTRKLALNDEVLQGDTLLAGPESRASISMIDEGRLVLSRAAQVVMEQYAYGQPGERAQSTLTLLQGGLRVITGAIARDDPDAVFINTSMATIGAHSADFSLLLCASGACRADGKERPLLAGLYAGVFEGEIAIANNTGNETLERGDVVRVRNQESPGDPSVEAAALLFDEAQLSRLDLRDDEPLGFWAWFRERFF